MRRDWLDLMASKDSRDAVFSPTSDGRSLEPLLEPLVHAANSPSWKIALRVLFLNGAVLEFVEDAPIPVLVSQAGSLEGVGHFIELAKTRFESNLLTISSTFVKRFSPTIEVVLREFAKQPSGDASGFAMAFGARMAGDVQVTRSFMRDLLGEAIQGAVSLSEGVAATAFEALSTRRREIMINSLAPDTYEEMISALHRLGLIESRMRVAICGSCGNHELLVAISPKAEKACTKCGVDWARLNLYVFKGSISSMKKDGTDLPVFASAFIRAQTRKEFIPGETDVYPLATWVSGGKKKGEIDVWVPLLRLGIEVKTYEDALAPLTASRIGGYVGQIAPQLGRYVTLGADRLAVVTNLPAGGAGKLEPALKNQLRKEGVAFRDLVVVPGNPDALVGFLMDAAKKCAKLLEKDFSDKMTERIQSGRAQRRASGRSIPTTARALPPPDRRQSRTPREKGGGPSD